MGLNETLDRRFPYLFLFVFLLWLDHMTKWLISGSLRVYGSVTVIPGFFDLAHTRNRGAIFGFLSGQDSPAVFPALVTLQLLAFLIVVFFFMRTPPREKGAVVGLCLIMSGALGNLSERVFRGYVTDFLDLYVKGWHWPSFNVADLCISTGAVLVFATFLFRRRN